MSILDMDASERRDPDHVRTKEFAQVRRGYDPDQVRRFLQTVAAWMDDLETDLAEARAAATSPEGARQPEHRAEPREDLYAALGVRVAEVLRTAEGIAEQVTRETEETAQRLLEEARTEAIRLRHRAQEEADRVREEAARALETARVEAERTISSLSERRTVLAAELHATKSRLMGIVTQLEEKAEQEATAESELRKAWTPEQTSGYIPPDDPWRDPAPPPDIPSFIPPPAPPRVFREPPEPPARQATPAPPAAPARGDVP